MKYITSEESVKQLTLEGAVFLSPKLDMEDPDVQGTGGLLGEYLALNANAEESTVNIQRNLSTGEVEIDGSTIYHKTEYRERRNHYAIYSVNHPIDGFDTIS